MKKYYFILSLFLLFSQFAFAQANLTTFFSTANAFFKQHVQYNKVKYQDIKRSPRDLNKLLDIIAKTDVSKNSETEQKAYHINAYNLLVIKTVIDNYPLKRPLELDGFFDKIKYVVGGKSYTLDKLEKDKLLHKYNDARLHFVLVCAAISCPPIANFAYMPEKLEEQLETRTKQAINNVVFIQYNDYDNKVDISEIFKWYMNDFQPTVKEFINKYRNDKLPEGIEMGYYIYNWTINDLPTKKNKK